MSIEQGSKEEYMIDICWNYTDFLAEFYLSNSKVEIREDSDEYASSNKESIVSPTIS